MLDASGRIVQLGDYEGVLYDANGNPVYGQRRLTYGESGFVVGDPLGRLATPWAASKDGGSGVGILFDIIASAGSADFPGNYPFIGAPLKDLSGRPIGGDLASNVFLSVKVRGAAPVATDVVAVCTLLATDSNPSGAAPFDGYGPGIVYDAGGVARVARTSALNGAGSINVATASTGVGASASVWRLSKSNASTRGFTISRTYMIDAAGDALTTNIAGEEVAGLGVYPYWVFLFYGHNNVGPAVSTRFDLYYAVPLNIPHVT